MTFQAKLNNLTRLLL